MAKQTYTATPITVSPPSDKSIEYITKKWKVTERAVAEKLLPEKNMKSGLNGILNVTNDFRVPAIFPSMPD